MLSLISRLCALCAVCALMQLVLGDADESGAMRMIGGLLMMHLVISGVHELAAELTQQRDLAQIFEILMK